MTLKLRSRAFVDDATLVMAIVNRTPDSFYDTGWKSGSFSKLHMPGTVGGQHG